MRCLLQPVLMFLAILGFSAGTMPVLAANGFVVEARRALDSVAVTEPEPPNLPDPAQYLLYKQIDKANATDNAVVGHRIHLGGFCKKASDNSDVPPPANAVWFWWYVSARGGWPNPGATAKYDEPPLKKKTTLAPPPPPDTRFQHFNWYNGGSIGGEPIDIAPCLTLNPRADTQEILEAPAETIKLYAPFLKSLKGTSTNPGVSVDPQTRGGTFYKKFGANVIMDIPETTGQGPLTGAGVIGFMQTVTGAITRSDTGFGTHTYAFPSTPVCDQVKNKDDALLRNRQSADRCTVRAGQPGATFDSYDVAAVLPHPRDSSLPYSRHVPPTLRSASYQCDFRCFSVYKPDGFRSIWVPVGKVDWAFKATAELKGNQSNVVPAPGNGQPLPPVDGSEWESPPTWEKCTWDFIPGSP